MRDFILTSLIIPLAGIKDCVALNCQPGSVTVASLYAHPYQCYHRTTWLPGLVTYLHACYSHWPKQCVYWPIIIASVAEYDRSDNLSRSILTPFIDEFSQITAYYQQPAWSTGKLHYSSSIPVRSGTVDRPSSKTRSVSPCSKFTTNMNRYLD